MFFFINSSLNRVFLKVEMHKNTNIQFVGDECMSLHVTSNMKMSESSRLAAVSHGKVRLGLVEHLLELCIRLQLSLVVIGVVAHPVGGNG